MAYISTVFLAPQASICLLQLGQKRKTVFVEFTKTSSVIGTANAIRIGIDKMSRFINCLATPNTQRIHYRVLEKKRNNYRQPSRTLFNYFPQFFGESHPIPLGVVGPRVRMSHMQKSTL